MKLKMNHLCAALFLLFEPVSGGCANGFELLHYDVEASDAPTDINEFVYLIDGQGAERLIEFQMKAANFSPHTPSTANSADGFKVMENLNQSPCGTHYGTAGGIKSTEHAHENFSYIKSMDEQISFAELSREGATVVSGEMENLPEIPAAALAGSHESAAGYAVMAGIAAMPVLIVLAAIFMVRQRY